MMENFIGASEYKNQRQELYSEVSKLLIRVQKQDEEAFDELYNKTYKYIYYCISKNGISNEAIEEVIQETYLDVYRCSNTLNNTMLGIAWMKKIAWHKSIDYIRKKNKDLLAFTEEQLEEQENMKDENILLPEDFVVNQERQQAIREILFSLPEESKRIITAFYFDECKITEIAEAYGIPEGTVKTKLHRTKLVLKEKIEEYSNKQGVKLYSTSLLTLLFFIHFSDAQAVEAALLNSANILEHIKYEINQIPLKTNASPIKAGTVSKAVGKTLVYKIVGGIAAVAIITSGTYAFNLNNQKKSDVPVMHESASYTIIDTKKEEPSSKIQEATKAANWNDLYKDLLLNRNTKIKGSQGYYSDYQKFGICGKGEYIYLKDFDGDGIPELFLENLETEARFIYQIVNNKSVLAIETTIQREIVFPIEGGFGIERSSGAGLTEITMYTKNKDGLFVSNETISYPKPRINEIMNSWTPIREEMVGQDLSKIDLANGKLTENK